MAKNTLGSFLGKVSLAALIGVALLAVRVVDLQALRGAFFRTISDQNRQFRLDVPAERGVFLDRFGDPLVINTREYFRYTHPLALYSQITPLTQPEALSAQVSDPFSVGYSLQRVYMRPFSTAHLLGYVSPVSADDLARDSSLQLTDMIGRLGLEQQYDRVLRGRDGYQEFEINALGEKQAAQASQPAVVGQPVTTTLDPYLSTVAWRAMGTHTGAVVILDADTGALLSLVSTPSFDSNLFAVTNTDADQARQTQLQQALADERKLFFNRSISGLYPPGSTFKPIVAVAGLESGAFDVNTTVDDQGVLKVGGQEFNNWYYTQYGRVEGAISLVRALARSNDSYFYKAAEWTGVNALAQKAREFGFGEVTGSQLPGEKPGLVPDPTWKEKTLGERWFLGDTYHFGIGQGDLLTTPLQLARMAAVFGNGGKICKTSLMTHGNANATGTQCGELGISDGTLSAVQEGMIGVCSAGGTAFPFFDWNAVRKSQLPEGLSPADQIREGIVACKTGTAEFGAADGSGRRRTHGLFVMTVGVDELLQSSLAATDTGLETSASAGVVDEAALDLAAQRRLWLTKVRSAGFPKTLAIVVVVESDNEQPFMEGSTNAGPVARAIFNWLIGKP